MDAKSKQPHTNICICIKIPEKNNIKSCAGESGRTERYEGAISLFTPLTFVLFKILQQALLWPECFYLSKIHMLKSNP
jgi:hypothetical protein